MSDPALMSLTAAADAVASGAISSRELTEACLKRIEVWQPVINAFIHVEADQALAMADAADAARARGESLGVMGGVPLAHSSSTAAPKSFDGVGPEILRTCPQLPTPPWSRAKT